MSIEARSRTRLQCACASIAVVVASRFTASHDMSVHRTIQLLHAHTQHRSLVPPHPHEQRREAREAAHHGQHRDDGGLGLRDLLLSRSHCRHRMPARCACAVFAFSNLTMSASQHSPVQAERSIAAIKLIQCVEAGLAGRTAHGHTQCTLTAHACRLFIHIACRKYPT